MAEILLARLVGPSGFERPVVLKRIRDDLDDSQRELTGMFLDEARLAAQIRHPNVIHVEDLGTDVDGAPYLVMEYLEGENASNVTRRLQTRGERLPHAVAAYIVAESCAGLHAAHELRDADGRPLDLVHRDVSPHNVFVTYEGVVKIVDFGVAQTAVTGDTVGNRGKVEYMAPEQATGEPLDRRADVFALGVVLYELLTGHRLFKRFTAAATVRALTNEPVVPPRRIASDISPALEAICMRALARSPGDRYPSAAEMRRELLSALRDLTTEDPATELATAMGRWFPDRIEDKRVLLRSVREGVAIDRVPVGDTDVTVELPTVEAAPRPSLEPRAPAPAEDDPPQAATVVDPLTGRQRRATPRRRVAWAAPLGLLALALGAGALSVRAALVRQALAPAASSGAVAAASAPAAPSASEAAEPPASAYVPEIRTTAAAHALPPRHRAASPPHAVSSPVPVPVPVPVPPSEVAPASASAAPSARGFRRFQ
jgi:serine/threonine-protein kinase